MKPAKTKPARTFLLGAAFGIVSQAAVAFQEQGGAAKSSEAPAPAAPSANMNLPNLPKVGTEIRIPGLGPIGSLPKFDFGLELLYGATEPRGIREDLNKSDPGEVQIRGTIKYKFNN